MYSFTETVLLNKHFLNFAVPLKCKECKLSNIKDVTLSNIVSAAKKEKFEVKNNTFVITKLLRGAARMAAFIAITVIVSPIGVVVNGVKTLAALATYFTIKKGNAEQWKKITELANATFKDLRAFAIGASATFLIGITVASIATLVLAPVVTTADIIACSIFSPILLFVSGALLGGGNSTINMLLRDEKEQERYFSLKLRENFGIVDKDGNHFSSLSKNYDNSIKIWMTETLSNLKCTNMDSRDKDLSKTIEKLKETRSNDKDKTNIYILENLVDILLNVPQ